MSINSLNFSTFSSIIGREQAIKETKIYYNNLVKLIKQFNLTFNREVAMSNK